MHRNIIPSPSRNLRVFALLETPERSGGPEEDAGDNDAGGYRAAFAVAACALAEFKRDFCPVDCKNVLHHPGQCAGASPTTALLRFCHSRSSACAARDDSDAIDNDRMDHIKTHCTSLFYFG